MTSRERFQRIMRYEPVDRLPVLAIENYYEPTALERWRKEGLSPGQSPEGLLGMDAIRWTPVNFGPLPAFEPRILSENEREYVETDGLGATVRRLKEAPHMYYGYIDHPVKTRADWEQYKRRFNPKDRARRPENLEQTIAELNASDQPLFLHLFPYFFRLGFYLMGMERFLTAFHDEPDLIHDMFSFWSGFVREVIRPYLGRVHFDGVAFTEDLAYKGGPHISPKTYAEFWLPYQDPIVMELRAIGVPIVCLWSAGNLEALLPLAMQHGINCIWPVERGARMDPVDLRARYGRGLLLGGGIAKEALIEGPSAIDREIQRLIPVIKEGGYLPALDDVVPPEVPLEHYRYFVNALRRV